MITSNTNNHQIVIIIINASNHSSGALDLTRFSLMVEALKEKSIRQSKIFKIRDLAYTAVENKPLPELGESSRTSVLKDSHDHLFASVNSDMETTAEELEEVQVIEFDEEDVGSDCSGHELAFDPSKDLWVTVTRNCHVENREEDDNWSWKVTGEGNWLRFYPII